MRTKFHLVLILSSLVPLTLAKSKHEDFTVIVEPGAVDCFYIANVAVGHHFELEFQVTDTSVATGNLDISLAVTDPNKELLWETIQEEDGHFEDSVSVSGDYKVCLDNSYSSFASKHVYIDVQITDEEDDYYRDYFDDEELIRMREYDHEQLEFTLEDVKDVVHTIRANVRAVSHFQAMLVANHASDFNVAQNNGEKVTMWSLIHLGFLVGIGFLQVFMIKSLFADKSFRHRMFARLEEQAYTKANRCVPSQVL